MLPSPFDNMQGGAASVVSIPSSMQQAPAPSLGPGNASFLHHHVPLLLLWIWPICTFGRRVSVSTPVPFSAEWEACLELAKR